MGDRLKRPVAVPIDGINPAVYQMLIKHCYPVDDAKDNALALCEEAGEVAGAMKKLAYIAGDKTTGRHVCEELGDVLFHVSQLAGLFGVTIEQLMHMSALKTMRWSGVAMNIPDLMIRMDATLVPGDAVFVAADYADLELKVLAHALERESNDNRTNES